jgi:hypothetical protein
VKSTRGKGDDTGILRIDFSRYSGSGSLEEISWEEFFEKFDREKLALVYQDTTARGQKSNFSKIVSRETTTSRASSRGGAQLAKPVSIHHRGWIRHRVVLEWCTKESAAAGTSFLHASH